MSSPTGFNVINHVVKPMVINNDDDQQPRIGVEYETISNKKHSTTSVVVDGFIHSYPMHFIHGYSHSILAGY
jgi:hypothetical protein